MNELQKRMPDLYAKLHPDGKFQAYFSQTAELREIAPQLSPEERWKRLWEINETDEAKACLTHQARVLQELTLAPGGMKQFQEYLQIQQEATRQSQALFDPKDMPPVSYAKEIAGYVLQAIGLYCDAVPHHTLEIIRLRFELSASPDPDDAAFNDEIQPTILLQFDTGTYHIDVGMLWDEALPLEREGRKNAQIWAESVWPEYKQETPPEQMALDAEDVRQRVAKQYPETTVELEIIR